MLTRAGPRSLQDLWLGARGGRDGEGLASSDDEAQALSHLGAVLFANVLRTFEARVAAAGLPGLPLVVVGSSAGGIALLNHVDEVRPRRGGGAHARRACCILVTPPAPGRCRRETVPI